MLGTSEVAEGPVPSSADSLPLAHTKQAPAEAPLPFDAGREDGSKLEAGERLSMFLFFLFFIFFIFFSFYATFCPSINMINYSFMIKVNVKLSSFLSSLFFLNFLFLEILLLKK